MKLTIDERRVLCFVYACECLVLRADMYHFLMLPAELDPILDGLKDAGYIRFSTVVDGEVWVEMTETGDVALFPEDANCVRVEED